MRYVRWKALNCGVWPPTSEFMLSLPLMRSLPKVSATATAALRINAAWTVPTLSPALGSSCGASSRSIFGRWQQCLFVELCWFAVICAAKLGCVYRLGLVNFFGSTDRRSLLGACDASASLGPLRGAGETDLRFALSRARAAVRPTVQAPDRCAFGAPKGPCRRRRERPRRFAPPSFRPENPFRAAARVGGCFLGLAFLGPPGPACSPSPRADLLARVDWRGKKSPPRIEVHARSDEGSFSHLPNDGLRISVSK